MTLLKQTSLFTEEALTSSPEVSHVSPTQPQANDSERQTSAIYSQRCYEQFARFVPDGSWAKMFSALLIGQTGWYSRKCVLRWKLKGTKYNRLYFQLQPSTPRTEGIGSGLLLKTPAAMDAYADNLSKKEQKFGNSGTLAQEIQSGFVEKRWPGLLPTPKTQDARGNVYVNRERSNLTDAIAEMLPTPTARDWKGGKTAQTMEKRKERGNEAVTLPDIFAQTSGTSQLSPRFVMQMMGFPPDWTALPFLGGDRKASREEETQ